MNLKKIFMISLIFTSSISSAFSMSHDFNIGLGGGYYQSPTFTYEQNPTSQYDWTIGGFLGGGSSFTLLLPMAIGIEYKGEYLSSYESLKKDQDKKIINTNSYQHALDIYYKLGLPVGSLPLGLQINVGLAMLNTINATYKDYQNGSLISSTSKNLNYFGLGLHTGLRFNISMLYIGADYIYMPIFSQGNGEWSKVAELGWKANKVNLSVGLILNKAILNSYK